MRIFLSFFTSACVLCLIAPQASATIDASLQMQLGNPSGAIADTNNHNHYLIQRTVEALDYSDNLGEPVWASWDLTAGDVGNSGRSPNFFTDTNLPAGFYEVTTDDYNGVGNINFNRGHMCPSEDRTDNTNDNNMVFFMSNIIPQAAVNNQQPWANFENYCRSLASGGNELLITCGPSLFNGTFLPSGKAQIPQYTWKIAVVVPLGAGTALSRITSATRVITIRIPNSNNVTANWQDYIASASQVEVDTGFTFFTALPTNIAAALRAEVDGQAAPPPVIAGFSPTSGATNTTVTITGTNFTTTTTVAFNGASAAFTVNSGTQITAAVPANGSSGAISVTAQGGTAVTSSNFTVIGGIVDLALSATHGANFTQGDNGRTYTIIVTNIGNLVSSGSITVTDALPVGLTATGFGGTGWTGSLSPLSCTRTDTVSAGSSFPPITLTVNVSSNAPTIVTNMAAVSGGGDANAANNVASDVTVINSSGGGNTNTVVLAGWDTSGIPGNTNIFGVSPFAPTTNAANLTVTGLTRGSGVGTTGTAAARGWGGNAWTSTSSTNAIAANQFFTFGFSAASGYTLSFNALSTFNYRRSGTGPANGLLQYQIGGGTFTDITTLAYPTNVSSGGTMSPLDLSGIPALQNVPPGTNVTFRVVNWGGTSSAGTWYVFDSLTSSAPDLLVQGVVAPVVTITPLESWRLQYFGATNNSGAGADNAVATSDGMANLLKYALGLNPLVAATNPIVAGITNNHLVVTMPKNPNATDVSFHIEQTTNLAAPAWTTSGTSTLQNTPTLLQVEDTNLVVGAVAAGYLRVRVSQP